MRQHRQHGAWLRHCAVVAVRPPSCWQKGSDMELILISSRLTGFVARCGRQGRWHGAARRGHLCPDLIIFPSTPKPMVRHAYSVLDIQKMIFKLPDILYFLSFLSEPEYMMSPAKCMGPPFFLLNEWSVISSSAQPFFFWLLKMRWIICPFAYQKIWFLKKV